jgi:hypothetical protein
MLLIGFSRVFLEGKKEIYKKGSERRFSDEISRGPRDVPRSSAFSRAELE